MAACDAPERLTVGDEAEAREGSSPSLAFLPEGEPEPPEDTRHSELELRARARLGTVLRNKYRLDDVLGFGGAATVYAATHRNGKRVALKLLHPELACEPGMRERFLGEGYAANRVKHPGAVTVVDDDLTEDGWPFLVMELLEGVTAHALWESQGFNLSPALVTAIVLQILDVMHVAHDSGIVHRDLKPDNLFLTNDGDVKVLDFGIARVVGSGRRTTAGTLLGTPAYMAPEQASSKTGAVDGRTDLWAIGAIAYALLVGDIVHPAENPMETLIFAATRPATPIARVAPSVPAPIAAVIDRALAFDKLVRWESATVMRAALAEAAQAAFGEVPGHPVILKALHTMTGGASVESSPRLEGQHRTTTTMLHPSTPGDVMPPPVCTPTPLTPLPIVVPPARRGVVVALAIAALTMAGTVFSGGVLLLHATTSSAAPASAAQPSAPPAATPEWDDPPARLVPTPSSTPVAADTTAPSPRSPAHVVAAPSASHAPTARSPSLRGSCTPPFTIDAATGRKKWKTECL